MNHSSLTIFSPEMRLILSAIRVDKNHLDREKNLFNNPINWSLVTDLAISHGVLPLLYRFLKKQKSGMVIQAEFDKQKNLYLNNVARNILLTKKLLDILKMLSDRGYEALPFKGPVIACQAYDDIGLRGFCDLDLLVRAEDFPFIYDLVESTDYRSIKPVIAKMKSIWKKSRRNFEFQAKNYFIDFHQQISQGPKFLSIEDEWNSLSTVELLSQPIKTLSIHNTILMLVLHGTHHGWTILKMVADLAHTVNSHESEIDWEVLVEKARKMGSLRMLMTGLLLGQDFCGLKIPNYIQNLIQNDKKARKLAGYFKEKTLEKQKSNLIPVTSIPRSLDSGYYKLRYWLYFVFTPTNLDVLAIRLPAFLYPVYFIIRPIRLTINLIKKTVDRIVRGKREKYE